MRKMLEQYPEREEEIRRIANEEGLNLSGDISDDWHSVVLEADAENWGSDWKESFHQYCKDIKDR